MEKNYNIQDIKRKYEIVGNSEGLMRALEIALMVASRDLSVLIIGESGVGKEAIPRIIHDHSARKHNKYFAINCGSIPEGTIDSELFGHAKGAFTGAIGEREGYFGAADGGTLFLDEVGELPLATQARLLRVLETGEYIRVGENTVKKTNVRIVAATNVNMEQAIREGKFRSDLYYRLNTIPIKLPPLRERGRDVELLFRKFAMVIADKYHCEPIRLTEDGRDRLMKYSWPGNIRQLRNLTEQLSAMFYEQAITSEMLNEFGITDDSNIGSKIVAQDPVHGRRDEEVNSPHSYANERDQIFSALTVLSNQVIELRKYILGMQNMGTLDLPATGSNLPTTSNLSTIQQNTDSMLGSKNAQEELETIHDYREDENPNREVASLSIRESEKRNTIKALERNHQNRRKAAKELGISERTLYRKIKEFGLEDAD